MRMKMGMIDHVSQNHQSMFNQATAHVQERLNQLVNATERRLEEATQGIFQNVRRDYKLLGDNTALGHVSKFYQEKHVLKQVLGGMENDFRQLLGLEKLEEPDELPKGEPVMEQEEMVRVMRQLGQLPPEVPQHPEVEYPEVEYSENDESGNDRNNDFLYDDEENHDFHYDEWVERWRRKTYHGWASEDSSDEDESNE